MSKSINWIEVEEKYKTGLYSMEQLAEKYKFNTKYGHRKAKKNNWVKGSTKKLVQEKTKDKIIELESIKEVEAKGKYFYLLEVIRLKLLSELLKDKPDFETLKSCKISSETLTNLRKEMYQLLDIQETAQKIESELNGSMENKVDYINKYMNQVEGVNVTLVE